VGSSLKKVSITVHQVEAKYNRLGQGWGRESTLPKRSRGHGPDHGGHGPDHELGPQGLEHIAMKDDQW